VFYLASHRIAACPRCVAVEDDRVDRLGSKHVNPIQAVCRFQNLIAMLLKQQPAAILGIQSIVDVENRRFVPGHTLYNVQSGQV